MRILVGSVVMVICVGCSWFSEYQALRCRRGDLTATLPDDHDKALDVLGQEWLNDAIVCTINDHTFVTPANPSVSAYYVSRGGEYEVGRLDDSITIIDTGFLIVSARDGDSDGHFDQISYDTWKSQYGYLSATDWNLDGQVDTRTFEIADGTLKREAWVDGEWKSYVIDKGLRLVDDPAARLRREEDGTWSIVHDGG